MYDIEPRSRSFRVRLRAPTELVRPFVFLGTAERPSALPKYRHVLELQILTREPYPLHEMFNIQLPPGFPDFGIEKPAWLQCGSFRMDSDGSHRSHQAGRPRKHLFGFRNRKIRCQSGKTGGI
jgi:hypothetical protein